MKRFNFGYFLSEGFHSIFTHGLMSFAAVCMIVACLIIMGSFSLVAVNVGYNLGEWEQENEFLAYVDESYTPEQTETLGAALKKIPNVSRVTFVAKEEALASFVDKYQYSDDADIYTALPDDVFRDRYRIHVVDIESFAQTIDKVRNTAGVVNIQAAPEVAQGFVAVSNIASAVAVILVVMLLVMSLFIIANTIKLATFTRRDEIAIMKMCGATNGFVRWPFIFEGMILGLFGAILAFFLEWGVYTLMGNAITASDTIQFLKIIPFQSIMPTVLGVFAGVGLLVGVGGSALTIRKFLQV